MNPAELYGTYFWRRGHTSATLILKESGAFEQGYSNDRGERKEYRGQWRFLRPSGGDVTAGSVVLYNALSIDPDGLIQTGVVISLPVMIEKNAIRLETDPDRIYPYLKSKSEREKGVTH